MTKKMFFKDFFKIFLRPFLCPGAKNSAFARVLNNLLTVVGAKRYLKNRDLFPHALFRSIFIYPFALNESL